MQGMTQGEAQLIISQNEETHKMIRCLDVKVMEMKERVDDHARFIDTSRKVLRATAKYAVHAAWISVVAFLGWIGIKVKLP